jgi:toxin FitB
MNIIDSSGGLEYFAGGPKAAFFSRPLQNTTELIVPSITIYEVFKTVLRQRNESDALQAVALMMHGSIVDLTANIPFWRQESASGRKCRWPTASFLLPPFFTK